MTGRWGSGRFRSGSRRSRRKAIRWSGCRRQWISRCSAPYWPRLWPRHRAGKAVVRGFAPVLKFKMLVLQSLHGLSLEQTEYLMRDRLSWMRFCQL